MDQKTNMTHFNPQIILISSKASSKMLKKRRKKLPKNKKMTVAPTIWLAGYVSRDSRTVASFYPING